MASTKITRTFSADSNRKKFTVSVWVKKSQHASAKVIWGGEISTGYVWLNMGSTIYFQQNPSSTIEFNSTPKFRDPGGWYHVVQQVDTAQSTNTNRMKFWVNGIQITDWATATYPSQDEEIKFQSAAYPLRIGEFGNSYWDGSMSHFHWCDGYAYEASDFGQTDATTGEWSIKTSPNVSYGTNGFFILKDGNSVTDQSGNSNNFTVAAGSLTKTEDNPSNNFATYNSLIGLHSNGNTLLPSMSNGNLNADINNNEWRIAQSDLAASSGKYYAEFKFSAVYGTDYAYLGIWDIDAYAQKANGYPYMADMANCFGLYDANGNVWTNATNTSYGVSYAQNDIIGCAMDLDNNKIYWSKNGTWMNSADPSAGTGGYSITADKTYAMGVQMYNNGFQANFGNGYFGTTEVTTNTGTGYQDADGKGRFYYAVPTNFRCLSTKGLNQ